MSFLLWIPVYQCSVKQSRLYFRSYVPLGSGLVVLERLRIASTGYHTSEVARSFDT